jgi:uncharacterized damage-inducible protein DinB
MEFDLKKSIEILSRTPAVLETLLQGLSNDWTHNNEGENTWSPFDVIGHLIHGEKTDWMTRMEIILSKGTQQKFDSFDRFAQFEESKGKTLAQLLEEFKNVRKKNLALLESKKLNTADLQKKGLHPVFGEVTLEQLLATWATHDLGHLGQVARVMAKQYKTAVGPWRQYLPILDK